MKAWKVLIVGLGIAASAYAALNFSSADQKYAARDQGATDAAQLVSTLAARDAYNEIWESSEFNAQRNVVMNSDPDFKYTNEAYVNMQMSRSALFGSLLEGSDLNTRWYALKDCYDRNSTLTTTHKGNVAYNYFYVGCLASLAKISNKLRRGQLAFELRVYLNTLIEIADSAEGFEIEGGGIHRVLAAIFENPDSKALNLYDPQRALDFADIAISSQAVVTPPFPEALDGTNYAENYLYKGRALLALATEEGKEKRERVDEARTVLEGARVNFANLAARNQLPKGREAESRIYIKKLAEHVGYIDSCKDRSDWNTCLIDKLKTKVGNSVEADKDL